MVKILIIIRFKITAIKVLFWALFYWNHYTFMSFKSEYSGNKVNYT